MKSQQQFIQWIESIIKITEKWKNKKINIDINLTDRNFDRHGSSCIYFSMIFNSFSIRTSGVRMMFDGKNNELVEVSTDFLIEVKITESKIKNEIILTEKLGKNDLHQNIFRRTILSLVI